LATSDDEAAERFKRHGSRDPLTDIAPSLLNSSDIADYVVQTGMIHPFDPGKLKPASYALPLLGKIVHWEAGGRNERHVRDLRSGDSFELEENSIAFVTLEPMLRVPDYMALRFDLRIKNVYRGLLLGTGPIIDPGFVGRLSLPLHNLTTNSYHFRGGDDLIWMVFTKISPNESWTGVEGPRSQRVGRYVRPRADRLHSDFDLEDYLDEAVAGGHVVSSLSESLSQAQSAKNWSRALSLVAAATVAALIVGILALILNLYTLQSNAPSKSDLDRAQRQIAQLQHKIERPTSPGTTQAAP
jgi:deoxycytidine triphosphate deaminase